MGNRTVSGYAAAVLDDPLSIIHAAVQRADPTLAASVLSAALAEAAPSITVQRRLAQALFENPELLTDRQPLGPPAMDRLIKALQGHGSAGIELPLCGVCHRDVDLTNRQGPLRICEVATPENANASSPARPVRNQCSLATETGKDAHSALRASTGYRKLIN